MGPLSFPRFNGLSGVASVDYLEDGGEALEEVAFLGHLQAGDGGGEAVGEVGGEEDLHLGVGEEAGALEEGGQDLLLRVPGWGSGRRGERGAHSVFVSGVSALGPSASRGASPF